MTGDKGRRVMANPVAGPPNVVLILADDLGYGDLRRFWPASKIPTPNLDALVEEGMAFTDAHATSSICSPSRYSLLTGEYNWRSRLKDGIVGMWDEPMIEDGQATIATTLRDGGYDTLCVGKWHLGWRWPTRSGRGVNETFIYGDTEYETNAKREEFGRTEILFDRPITGGPIDRGFDEYFGVDVPNFPPYAWIEGDRIIGTPCEPKPDRLYGNEGLATPGWSHEAMLPMFTARAADFIRRHGPCGKSHGTPFFLYFPLTAPHSPVTPNREFVGRSGLGSYGDLVCEIDDLVGQIRAALAQNGLLENTIFVFTSDNGPEFATLDDEGAFERARRTGHYSMGDLRGVKHDAWEGGHRVPLLVSWPARIKGGTTCPHVVSLVDLMATVLDAAGVPCPAGAATDSISMLPLLTGASDMPTREFSVQHSRVGVFVGRAGKWVLIEAPIGATYPEPDWWKELRCYDDDDQPAQLFELDRDISQRRNLYAQRPAEVEYLTGLLQQVRQARATGARFKNITDG